MSTATKKQWHDVDISGRWKLIYKYGNSIGPEAFGGKHLATYRSPFDGTKVYRRSVDNKALTGYMVDKLATDLTPDTNPDHKLLISWLICHNEVVVEGVKGLDDAIVNSKTGRKLVLRCVDYVEMADIDEEDFIDKVIGKLVQEKGGINIDKLRHILAGLNMAYSDSRFTGIAEKKALRSKLKTFTRSSIENARLVDSAIKQTENSEQLFIFKEMLKYKVIADYGGLYKFNNVPLGTSADKVAAFWSNNPEVKAEALQELAKHKK